MAERVGGSERQGWRLDGLGARKVEGGGSESGGWRLDGLEARTDFQQVLLINIGLGRATLNMMG